MSQQHGAMLSVIGRDGREISRTPQETAVGAIPAAIAASREHGRAVIVTFVFDAPPRLHVMDYREGEHTGADQYDLPGDKK